MTAPSFVTLTALDGSSIRVNTLDNIVNLAPIPVQQLPFGVTDGTWIEFDDRTIGVQGTVAVTAAILNTPVTNGLGPIVLPNFPVGAVAYGSLGTDAVSVAGTLYTSEGYNPQPRTVTTISVLNGTTVATALNKVIYYITNAAGLVLATTALAGAATAGADAFQGINLIAPIVLPAGRYFAGFQMEGILDKHRTMAAGTYPNATRSQVGVFGTIPASITAPTTFNAGVGPFHLLS